MCGYPENFQGLLADLHPPGLEYLDTAEVLDGEGARAGPHRRLIRLPLVGLRAFRDAVLPPAERVPERPA